MSARRNALYAGLLVAGVAVALSGCAVLRIDVDVYKGPLANEAAVQMEQFAAMAIGAKPLLIALRDRLQWPKDADRACARGRAWYQGRFFPEPVFVEGISKSDAEGRKPGCRYGQRVAWNESAGRVNAVLSLYENSSDETGLIKFLAIGKKEFERYQSAVAVLRPDAVQDKKFWESIESGFKDPFPPVLFELKEALKGLLHPNSSKRLITRHVDKEGNKKLGVFGAFEAAAKKISGDISAVRKGNFGTYEEWEELGRVEEFDLLRWPENLKGIASLLFKPDAEKEAQKFKRRVEELAGAYFEAREAMQVMALNGLSALKFLNSTDYQGKDRSRLSSIAVDIQLELMQPQHIALAIQLPNQAGVAADDYPPLRELYAMLTEGAEAKKFWDEKSLECNRDPGNCWKPERFEDAKRIIGRALYLNPVEGVDLLLAADRILRGKPPGKPPLNWTVEPLNWAEKFKIEPTDPRQKACEAKRTLPNCQPIKELEQFGLARGPSLKAKEQEEIKKKFREGAGQLAASAAVGFGRGRLPAGIETLIEEYLQETAAHPLAGTGDETTGKRERAKVRLSDALVRFAEKVLFIANNDKLLSENLKGIDRYVLVLQAVGNSILIQADELRTRAKFELELQYREAPEIWAQEKGTQGLPDQPYREWSAEKGIAGTVSTGTRSRREVLDDLIALLRYKHIKAVKDEGKEGPNAKKILDALVVAYDQRAGMAYIRPAGAYLRSSYPATSLQDDPRLGWSNMLGRHGLRTSPIIGPLYNWATEDGTRAEITAEIDKQFWQTINSVRVAGAGNTNYVIAKDDIGNWYVKKYSADPEPILKSAKSLALFGMGGQFDPDLAAQALQEDGLSQLDDTARVPTPPALQSAYRVPRNKYVQLTGSVYEALRALLADPASPELPTNLKTAIKTKWEGNELFTEFLEDLGNALDLAASEALQPASEELEAIQAKIDLNGTLRAEAIVGALTRIKSFQETLKSNIRVQKIVARAKIKRDALIESQQDAKMEWVAAGEKRKTVEKKRKAAEKKRMAEEEKRNAAEEKRKAAEESSKPADEVKELADKVKEFDNEVKKLEDEVGELKVEVGELQTAEAKEKAKFDTLSEQLKMAEVNVKEAPLAVPTAIEAATDYVQRLLVEKIKSRLNAVKEYEERILVLGEINPQ